MDMKKRTRLALLNSAIAGGLVFLGAFTDGQITSTEFIATLAAAMAIFLTKMRDFLSKINGKKAMKGGIFDFYGK